MVVKSDVNTWTRPTAKAKVEAMYTKNIVMMSVKTRLTFNTTGPILSCSWSQYTSLEQVGFRTNAILIIVRLYYRFKLRVAVNDSNILETISEFLTAVSSKFSLLRSFPWMNF